MICCATGPSGDRPDKRAASECIAGEFRRREAVGEGVSELRIDYGPGYRVYFAQHGRELVILLAGGDKRSQRRDIEKALELARML